MSQFSHLKNETNNIIYLRGLLGELNEIVYTSILTGTSKLSIIVSYYFCYSFEQGFRLAMKREVNCHKFLARQAGLCPCHPISQIPGILT